MHGSILIIGKNKEKLNKEIQKLIKEIGVGKTENNPDLHWVQKDESKKQIGIAQAKEAIKYLNQKPFAHDYKIVLIPDAELLSDAAQNALLKTLEELPEYASLILGTPTKNAVLPTILSRCRRVHLNSKKANALDDESLDELIIKFGEFEEMPLGERLGYVDELAKHDREEITLLFEHWIEQGRGALLKKPSIPLTNRIEFLNEIYTDLKTTNVNLKLALENLAINL